ncbi:MAG: dihydrodipicolinate synthase family protein [Gammaproteobacteria bacterium]|nr:dihydrodipicolinate synthase family protein [Gammaproteobacteria bacterium]NIR83818.1 dihydrodipicolinate synthase family protein [Gammaproteobacteria bacterium]NIR88235.1 dihydrodipicolinate synthase family protein [Gammaproteobacteria bacterium]NIU05144.1 dihydrodipicolinate synthase family protein [Gammaproteobacteria bacterium]NIV51981.1 dihydrodipicolinate synthase family protein [Gammaproteobacteria bacterium]
MSTDASLSGVWVPTLTPLRADLSIDAERFVAHARWLLENGCHGVVLFGTTGEATSFATDERSAMLDRAIDAGLPAERLVVGTGCCALPDTVRLTRHALERGCFAVLALPPFYYKGVSDEGLFRSYAEIIERIGDTRLQLYLYHFPRLSGVPITAGLIERLLRAYPDTVKGIKDSSGDWTSTSGFIERFPGLAVLPGAETLLRDALQAGGTGCITAMANANPAAIRKTYDACCSDDPEAPALQSSITQIREIIEVHSLVGALKALISHYRQDPDWRRVRPPLLSFPEAGIAELAASLEAGGYVFPGSAPPSE